MTLPRTIAVWALALLALPGAAPAQEKPAQDYTIEPLTDNGFAEYDFARQRGFGTNGVMVRYGNAVLTADRAILDGTTGDVFADGSVHIQQGDQVWVSQHVRYNFNTRQMEAAQFRTGQPPLFALGEGLSADITNKVYFATNAVITADDISQPALRVRAKRIKIIPGKRLVAWGATVYAGQMPVAYFPYYVRNLGEHANNFNLVPGYRTLFGPFILANYTWYLSDELDGAFHLDYREKRGPGVGPDFNYHLGRWGEGWLRYYYTHDKDPNADQLGVPIPENRERLNIAYQAHPSPDVDILGRVRYESDYALVRDFFESEYRENPQPSTFFEVNKFWQNFSVDSYVQPRVNNFLETVERLPDVRLTGFRQQIGATPLYYESESSVGYYRRLFAENVPTNTSPSGLNYAAARADTFHQILLPETFFGWLNVTPRVGGRLTYYSQATGPGATTTEQYRGVFNTGAELSLKASRVWPQVQNSLLDVDGLRHIIEPSVNYVFVPSPSTAPNQLPQFDYVLPSLRLLPIDFPDFNDIDSIDSQNVIRWGLHNRLQTKREGKVVNLLNWDLYTDWLLKPNPGQTTFSDLYSDLTFRPRSWLTVESLLRYELNAGIWRMALTTLTLQPNNQWSFGFAHYYLVNDTSTSPTSLGEGNNLFSSTVTYRLNENWGFRMSHRFEAADGVLEEQAYTVYRDLRSWTAALTFFVRNNRTGPEDYTVAFTFSLKAFPRLPLNRDVGGPASLLGY
jgi:lipopolysaccharide assembly outer membrane protein LptD (OstA)